MGNRRRTGGRSTTRRSVIAGGFVAVGAGFMLTETGAFSQTAATRGASIGVGPDGDALLGLDVAPLVAVGSSDEPLVDVTNNAETPLEVTVELVDPLESESVSPSETTLQPGESIPVTVSIASERDGGTDALAFDVTASDGESLSVEVRRRTSIPGLNYAIIDRTQNSNVEFDVQYQVLDVPDFDRMELFVENVSDGDRNLNESFTVTDPEGVISYPSSGNDGGAEGSTYEFTFEVLDEERGSVIFEQTTRVADGESDDDDDDFGGDDDPILESFTVTDNTDLQRDQVQFVVEYELSNTENFGHVEVTFDNQNHSWSDETVESSDEPTGTVTYPDGGGTQGGTSNQPYEISVEVWTESGIPVDSGSVTTVADGEDPPPYVREE
ncbi:hypothetical protein [Natrarchaeobius chitinivorans]|uniref:Uncharacterized protein n=1 Tax=Natrarchaeobius chitinivorans TaxID=1679083 RepID=A0A3N6LQZ9_NATCH|nr:hypothetical protein [Natrarchaeobius chitinivorans]RQG92098.1 hypothetical protein EA473_17745 [Natrarchaeobius chitinivorans]